MAETLTNRGKFLIVTGGLDPLDLRMAVILGTQTGVNSATLNFMSDLDAVSGVSFHTERIALTGETETEDDANGRVNVDASDVTFAAAPGVTAQGVVIYDEGTGADNGRPIISIHTTNFPQPMDGGLVVQIADWMRAS